MSMNPPVNRDQYRRGSVWPSGESINLAGRSCHLESDGTILLTQLPGGGYYLQHVSRYALVKITSGTGEAHVGDVYRNGYDEDATEEAVTIKVAGIKSNASLPTSSPTNEYLAVKVKWDGAMEWTIRPATWGG